VRKALQIIALSLPVCLPAPAAETCDLSGVLKNSAGHEIAGAVVTALPGQLQTRSDGAGRFAFAGLVEGRVEIVVVGEGFAIVGERLSCRPGESHEISIELRPAFGEEMVVTGTRTAKRLADVPVPTQIVPRDDIEIMASRTLADAVEFTSGLRVESNCQNCNFSQIRMLGLEGPYSQILIDGMPTVSSLALVYGIEQFPARLIDSIEVVKGGGSATYGAGSVGGVVNLIPHQPSRTSGEVETRYISTGGEPGFSVSALGDWASADRSRLATLFGQKDAIQPVDVDGDGFSEVARRDLLSLGTRFEQYLLDSRGRFVAEANYTDAERRGGELAGIDRPPHETQLTEEISTERLGLSASWLHQVSSRFDYRLTTSVADTHRASYYGAGFDPNAYGTTDNPLWIIDSQANRYSESGTLTVGLQYTRDEIEDVQLGYGRVIRETYRDVGAYVQDDRRIGKSLNLLYGARLDDHSALEDPIVSPRAALMWTPRPTLTVRTSFATGFRPPAVFDEDLHIVLVGGGEAQVVHNAPDLLEESSTGYLLGVEWRPAFGGKGTATLFWNLFRTDLDDLFHNIEADDPTTPEVEFVRINQGDARVQGVEIAGSMRWGSRLSADLGFVLQNSRFGQPEPDFGSRDFFRTPDRYGSVGVIWRLSDTLDLFSGLIYTGPMKVPHYAGYIEEERLEVTESSLTLDVNLARTLALPGGAVLKLTAGVRNLTDEFQSDLDKGPDRDSAYVYGPRSPRSLILGLSVGI
jgi:outer membrane receptor for ferrienterochelin and colicins